MNKLCTISFLTLSFLMYASENPSFEDFVRNAVESQFPFGSLNSEEKIKQRTDDITADFFETELNRPATSKTTYKELVATTMATYRVANERQKTKNMYANILWSLGIASCIMPRTRCLTEGLLVAGSFLKGASVSELPHVDYENFAQLALCVENEIAAKREANIKKQKEWYALSEKNNDAS